MSLKSSEILKTPNSVPVISECKFTENGFQTLSDHSNGESKESNQI